MRKRIVKRRKRIKGSAGVGEPSKKSGAAKRTDGAAKPSSALVELGRRAVERGRRMWETEDIPSEEIPIDTFEKGAAGCRSKDRHPNTLKLICGSILVFSILTASAIACFSFALAVKDVGSEEEPPVSELPDGEESGKVVFVRPSGSTDGWLTAPEIYAKCSAAVVSVSTSLSAEYGMGKGVGTGFIISEDGYIATAAHVIKGAEGISAVLFDGKEYEARVVASEELSDIALLKIDASSLTAVEFGLSSELLAGERVYAIGTPVSLDYAGTLTSGEISHPERIIPISLSDGRLEKKLRLIQTNAELNTGSSGSPLFDEYGRVVGMVTMKLGGDYSGIGFALPSEGAYAVLEAMMSGKELNSSVLSGVVIMAPKLDIIGESAEENGVYGYKITGFSELLTSAATALHIGDLIVKIDNTVVYREGDISAAIEKKAPNDTVSITVIRSGQRLTFDVILGG